MMPQLEPLRFEPIYRRYVWGGRRLESMLGRRLGEGNDYAESWELVDRDPDQSRVTHGAMQGKTLGWLRAEAGPQLFGRHHPQDRFPLLFKFLDAHRNLSVQVHPNDEQAARQNTPDLGKTEAWVVLHADPGSLIYAGLKPEVDACTLQEAIGRGTVEQCLHHFHPQTGDCVFVPAGAVHALGAGLLVAEIQQASDTTYRLFDWNRTGPDGQPRPLHVREALEVIDYSRGPIGPQHPQATGQAGVERLAACEKFVLDRRTVEGESTLPDDDRFHILAVLRGEVEIEGDPARRPLRTGQTLLLPARCVARRLRAATTAVMLDMYLP